MGDLGLDDRILRDRFRCDWCRRGFRTFRGKRQHVNQNPVCAARVRACRETYWDYRPRVLAAFAAAGLRDPQSVVDPADGHTMEAAVVVMSWCDALAARQAVAPLPAAEEPACAACDGTGHTDCGCCFGFGFDVENAEVPCVECDGKGFIRCPACEAAS